MIAGRHPRTLKLFLAVAATEGTDSGSQRCYASGGPIFGRPKMGEKTASPLRAGPPLCPIGPIRFDAAQPLNGCPLASDLRRVSYPTSPDGLLKGQAKLGVLCRAICVYQNCAGSRQQKRNAPQPEGRQAKSVIHRTDYEGPAARKKFSGTWVSPLLPTD